MKYYNVLYAALISTLLAFAPALGMDWMNKSTFFQSEPSETENKLTLFKQASYDLTESQLNALAFSQKDPQAKETLKTNISANLNTMTQFITENDPYQKGKRIVDLGEIKNKILSTEPYSLKAIQNWINTIQAIDKATIERLEEIKRTGSAPMEASSIGVQKALTKIENEQRAQEEEFAATKNWSTYSPEEQINYINAQDWNKETKIYILQLLWWDTQKKRNILDQVLVQRALKDLGGKIPGLQHNPGQQMQPLLTATLINIPKDVSEGLKQFILDQQTDIQKIEQFNKNQQSNPNKINDLLQHQQKLLSFYNTLSALPPTTERPEPSRRPSMEDQMKKYYTSKDKLVGFIHADQQEINALIIEECDNMQASLNTQTTSDLEASKSTLAKYKEIALKANKLPQNIEQASKQEQQGLIEKKRLEKFKKTSPKFKDEQLSILKTQLDEGKITQDTYSKLIQGEEDSEIKTLALVEELLKKPIAMLSLNEKQAPSKITTSTDVLNKIDETITAINEKLNNPTASIEPTAPQTQEEKIKLEQEQVKKEALELKLLQEQMEASLSEQEKVQKNARNLMSSLVSGQNSAFGKGNLYTEILDLDMWNNAIKKMNSFIQDIIKKSSQLSTANLLGMIGSTLGWKDLISVETLNTITFNNNELINILKDATQTFNELSDIKAETNKEKLLKKVNENIATFNIIEKAMIDLGKNLTTPSSDIAKEEARKILNNAALSIETTAEKGARELKNAVVSAIEKQTTIETLNQQLQMYEKFLNENKYPENRKLTNAEKTFNQKINDSVKNIKIRIDFLTNKQEYVEFLKTPFSLTPKNLRDTISGLKKLLPMQANYDPLMVIVDQNSQLYKDIIATLKKYIELLNNATQLDLKTKTEIKLDHFKKLASKVEELEFLLKSDPTNKNIEEMIRSYQDRIQKDLNVLINQIKDKPNAFDLINQYLEEQTLINFKEKAIEAIKQQQVLKKASIKQPTQREIELAIKLSPKDLIIKQPSQAQDEPIPTQIVQPIDPIPTVVATKTEQPQLLTTQAPVAAVQQPERPKPTAPTWREQINKFVSSTWQTTTNFFGGIANWFASWWR